MENKKPDIPFQDEKIVDKAEHEVWLSFNSDDEAVQFYEWLHDVWPLFEQYKKDNPFRW